MKTLKFMLMLAATVAAGAVRAEVDSYLYWMVSDDMKYVWEAPDKPGTPVTYDYAKISADGGDTYLSFYGTDGELPGVDTLDKGRDGVVGFASSPAFSSNTKASTSLTIPTFVANFVRPVSITRSSRTPSSAELLKKQVLTV